MNVIAHASARCYYSHVRGNKGARKEIALWKPLLPEDSMIEILRLDDVMQVVDVLHRSVNETCNVAPAELISDFSPDPDLG